MIVIDKELKNLEEKENILHRGHSAQSMNQVLDLKPKHGPVIPWYLY